MSILYIVYIFQLQIIHKYSISDFKNIKNGIKREMFQNLK